MRKLHIAFPALIDSIDNHVEKAYTGWPDRLFLVGPDQKIRFKSEAGPFGFLPKNLEAALARTRSEPLLSRRYLKAARVMRGASVESERKYFHLPDDRHSTA